MTSVSAGKQGSAGPAVVAIGGGHGLARTLAAARINGWVPTAVVSVADDGGSSGRLRRDLGVIPPGDLRMAMSTLCPDPVRRSLLEHRFDGGELAGHALGNLVLVAGATQRGGDMAAGLAMLATMFGARGRVLPVCDQPLDLVGTHADGTVVTGQRRIAGTVGIRSVALADDGVTANELAVSAVEAADLVVVGPGSWFTSLLPPLMVPGMAAALTRSDGARILVSNIRQQPGETTGLDARAHLDVLFEHLPDEMRFDVLVANDTAVDVMVPDQVHALAPPDDHPRIDRIVTAGLADAAGNHHAGRLAEALRAVAADSPADARTAQ